MVSSLERALPLALAISSYIMPELFPNASKKTDQGKNQFNQTCF
jgi:hypothetical protein